MSLVYYDRWLNGTSARSPLVGPGAAAVDEFRAPVVVRVADARRAARAPDRHRDRPAQLRRRARDRPVGRAGELALALVLIIGFGLHNATEGFGIVGPMAGEPERPSWGFLALMGLIGGGPTFVGTVIGQAWVSPALETRLLRGRRRLDPLRRASSSSTSAGATACRRLVTWMLLLGLAARLRHRLRARRRRGLNGHDRFLI